MKKVIIFKNKYYKSNNYSTVHIVGCNAEAEIREIPQSSPLGNVSIEHENESICD
jgi:hypothetical protein